MYYVKEIMALMTTFVHYFVWYYGKKGDSILPVFDVIFSIRWTSGSVMLFAFSIVLCNASKNEIIKCRGLIHQARPVPMWRDREKRVRWIEPLHLWVRDQSQECKLFYDPRSKRPVLNSLKGYVGKLNTIGNCNLRTEGKCHGEKDIDAGN